MLPVESWQVHAPWATYTFALHRWIEWHGARPIGLLSWTAAVQFGLTMTGSGPMAWKWIREM